MNYLQNSRIEMQFASLIFLVGSLGSIVQAEEVGDRWGTEQRERAYYPIVNVPLPKDVVIEVGAFAVLPDSRVAIGTRHGEIYLMSGIDDKKPNPSFDLFATGLDEIFGLAYQNNSFYVTQSCERAIRTKMAKPIDSRQSRTLGDMPITMSTHSGRSSTETGICLLH